MARQAEKGQILTFFIFIILALGLMTAVGLQIGRIVYARGEVGKAADAAEKVNVRSHRYPSSHKMKSARRFSNQLRILSFQMVRRFMAHIS